MIMEALLFISLGFTASVLLNVLTVLVLIIIGEL